MIGSLAGLGRSDDCQQLAEGRSYDERHGDNCHLPSSVQTPLPPFPLLTFAPLLTHTHVHAHREACSRVSLLQLNSTNSTVRDRGSIYFADHISNPSSSSLIHTPSLHPSRWL